MMATTLEKELRLIRQRLDSIEDALAEEMSEDDKRARAEALKEHREGKTVPLVGKSNRALKVYLSTKAKKNLDDAPTELKVRLESKISELIDSHILQGARSSREHLTPIGSGSATTTSCTPSCPAGRFSSSRSRQEARPTTEPRDTRSDITINHE